jgi:inosine/xanthosine triphosphate pyrophosphatase family protein
MRLLVATTNPNKLREIQPLLAGTGIELMTLGDLPPVPEPGSRRHLLGARQGARLRPRHRACRVVEDRGS